MTKISIVDYGLGNIRAIYRIYQQNNISVNFASKPEDFRDTTHIILPGVGAFDWAMTCLEKSGLQPILNQLVIEKKIPILGICVGMQIMAHSSEEGEKAGLGWLKTKVLKFDPELLNTPLLPHMGWNHVYPNDTSTLFHKITKSNFYFLHSYYFSSKNKETLATCDYGGLFAAAVNQQNIYGTQFHPEKSHNNGIRLLKNFSLV